MPKPNGIPIQGDARQLYEQLVASINGIVWEVDVATFLFTFVSEQAERLLGYPLGQWFLPGFWLDHLHRDDREWAYEFCMKATREKRPHEMEYRMIAADGRVVWLRDIVSVTVEGGVATKLRGIMVDITERKRAEEALRESEELFRFLAEKNPDPIMLLDEEGRPVYVSPAFRRLLDRDPTIALFEDVHPDDLEEAQRAWREVWAKGESFATFRLSHADGSWRIFEAWGSLVQYKGKPHALGVSRDITERKRAEEALRHAENQLRTLIEHYPDYIARFDGQCRHLYVSPSVTRAFGMPLEQFVGKTLHEMSPAGPPGQNEALEAGIRRALEHGVPNTLEARWPTKEGERVFEVRHIPERDEHGRIIGVLGLTRDITERKRAEEELRESEELFRFLAESTNDAIVLRNEEGRPVYVSPSFRRLFDRDPEALVKSIHPEDFEAARRAWREVWAKGEAFATYRIAQVDGSWRILEGGGWRVQYKGKPHVLSVVRDVTDKRRAEEELRRSAAYLAEAQRLSKAGSWAWNVATREFVHWSQGHYILHGLDPQKGIPSWEEASHSIHPEDRARCLEAIEKAIQERTACEFEYRSILPDGSIKHIHLVAHPFFNETGELVEYVGTEMDITERKRAEAALRESEQRYREVFNYSSECIFLIDVSPDGRFRFAAFNPTEEKAAGFASAEVAGKFIEDVLPPHLAAAVIPNYRRCVEAGTLISYDEELDLPTGRKSFHTTLIPVRDESGRIYRLIGIGHDVTATRRAEAELRRSEEMLRRAQGIGHVGSWVFDVEEGVFIGSEEGCRMCGWESGPHRGEELIALVHPDDLPRMQTAWQATLDGAPYEIEHRLVVDGKLLWVNVRAEPELDAEGRVIRITGVTQDITERKAAEEALRASLREKDVLLKEVHHRVKNNLQLISSLLALQAGKMKDHAAAEAFAESQNRVRSIALVHENLYRTGDLASVRLSGHLDSLCAHLLRSYNIDPDRIKLDLRVADVTLDLDRSIRLGLLVNELVSNVFKHAFPGERSGRVLVKLDMPRTGCYILVVSDNGVGLPPDLVPGHSDSLGLQLVADLTEQLSGTLGLDREGGTTFTIRFPARCQEDSRS
ncbi:MAG TPA: PAS domain S-box protein [Gemmataceae bacterium]|nr:PAS domain S-box protein [Gemmataceae bacterium]